jgi:hypothetical protein
MPRAVCRASMRFVLITVGLLFSVYLLLGATAPG